MADRRTFRLLTSSQPTDQKTDSGTAYQQMVIDAELQTGKRDQKTDRTQRSPLRR
jgi:hypothetical protein